MNVLGHSTGTSLAVQHVSGQSGRLAATPADVAVFGLFIPWDGDEDELYTFWSTANFPWIKAFYKCAYHDGATWTLPAVTQVIRYGGAGDDVPSSGRPYWTHGWPTPGWTDYSFFKMAGTDIAAALGGGAVATAIAGYFAGAYVYSAATDANSGLPACGLEFGIPPYAHHDLAIEVFLAWQDSTIGTILLCWASACRVDAQEE